jgi:hypothetical protein
MCAGVQHSSAITIIVSECEERSHSSVRPTMIIGRRCRVPEIRAISRDDESIFASGATCLREKVHDESRSGRI